MLNFIFWFIKESVRHSHRSFFFALSRLTTKDFYNGLNEINSLYTALVGFLKLCLFILKVFFYYNMILYVYSPLLYYFLCFVFSSSSVNYAIFFYFFHIEGSVKHFFFLLLVYSIFLVEFCIETYIAFIFSSLAFIEYIDFFFENIVAPVTVNSHVYAFTFNNILYIACFIFLKVSSFLLFFAEKTLLPFAPFLFFLLKFPFVAILTFFKSIRKFFNIFKLKVEKTSESYLDKFTNTDGEDVLSFSNDMIEFVEQSKFFSFDNFFFFIIDFCFFSFIAIGLYLIVSKFFKYFKNK